MKTYGRIWLADGLWNIQTEPYVQIRLKRIFSKVHRHGHGTITLSHNPENCRDLEWFCTRYPHDVDEASAEFLRNGSRQHRDMIVRLERIIDPDYVPRSF